jgi:uncharacterized protein YuzE
MTRILRSWWSRERTMKIKYMKETDSMFIIFSDSADTDSVEIDDGVVADVDKDGNLIGLEFYSVKNKFENSLKLFQMIF